MSYDIGLYVKVAGCDKCVMIDEPEHSNPTYNLSKMFSACMDWNYEQWKGELNGKCNRVFYRCDVALEKIEHGIKELSENRKKYEKYNPPNGWGDLDGALVTLKSLKECICKWMDEIPLSCLYMAW